MRGEKREQRKRGKKKKKQEVIKSKGNKNEY